MSKYGNLFASLEQRGKDFLASERQRQRAAYIQSKASARIVDWTLNDDKAFDAIDQMVANLAEDAGFTHVPAPAFMPAPPPQRSTIRPAAPVVDTATLERAIGRENVS